MNEVSEFCVMKFLTVTGSRIVPFTWVNRGDETDLYCREPFVWVEWTHKAGQME